MSGFDLTSDKQRILTYNYDFNITLYNNYKENYLSYNCPYYNCLSCSFNSEQCEICKSGYYSNGEYCLPCPSNCLDCQYF